MDLGFRDRVLWVWGFGSNKYWQAVSRVSG